MKSGDVLDPQCSSHGRGLQEFFLLGTFRRSRVRLSDVSVSRLLRSCFSDNALAFKVLQLSCSVLKFSVATKEVGLFVSLWANGGPNWKYEFSLWLDEQEKEWIPVTKKKKASLADVVRPGPAPKSFFSSCWS